MKHQPGMKVVLRNFITCTADNGRWQDSFDWGQLTGGKTSETPVYSALFDCSKQPANRASKSACFSLLEQYECLEPYDVRLSCFETSDALKLALRCAGDTFQAEDVLDLRR